MCSLALIKFGGNSHVMCLQMLYTVAVLKLATLVPPLKNTALHTENVAVVLVGLSRVNYCQIAGMLPALSDSSTT